jgi:peptidoglycan/LPS O-acetylase OafA/YrhL
VARRGAARSQYARTRLAASCSCSGRSPACGNATCRCRLPGAALAVALSLADAHGFARDGPLFALLLSYVVLVVAYHPALRTSRARGQARLLVRALRLCVPDPADAGWRLAPDIAPSTLFVARSFLTLAVAALSWHALEAPALRLKSRFRMGSTSRP